jgi:16S rRNA (guanine966-N2)-methyltransferase
MPKPTPQDDETPQLPRIVGGKMRGRKLLYTGDQRTRPMKDRTREAIFNLLGPHVVGTHAIDLFAGTGALGLEAVSRGAARATFIEQHFPTADLIKQNIATLQVEVPCTVEPANTFIWAKRNPRLGDMPWVVFCSPPYAFYVDRGEEMLSLLQTLIERAPAGSVIVVEADKHFDFSQLPRASEWDMREYYPAHVGMLWME